MAFIKNKERFSQELDDQVFALNSVDELIAFAKQHQIVTSPLDVSRLTKELGITMRMQPMEGEESGCLKQTRDGSWVMTVNSLHHPHRQRFTIAHELAHYVKHTIHTKEFIDKAFFRDGQINAMESEANRFAAELLMPEDEFKRYVTEKSKKVMDIANYFQVSSMAVRIRAKQLGYSGHDI
ncbi:MULTISPECIES: ImmA/IrrE family metallo-endopeptidase [Yersinia]|uniref:ImmA/IrrE family metallo-endopeptidase n=1 Tax=Yersinia TaxID=629 RepID=UPI0009B719CE|nr:MULTISPECIES: ImmA/IrrE family metallo-endopeptidase [Yersinia]ARB85390.1 ImmA/IrrE family metallo-endopeptidase [Yersinia sp. FDAARGOS_228]AVL35208.1 ImmA/IrrE family metallo-endopeptidase [Yersinia intermedia]